MGSMTDSAQVRRINGQCIGRAVALHIPTNHSYSVVLEVINKYADVLDMEGRAKRVDWSAWTDNDIWGRV